MEHVNPLLIQAAVYFAAAVAGVAVSHRLGLGSVAGYLLAGIAIGPWGLNVVGQVEDVRAFAELGVVFLLFVIGLELEPGRLWEMRGQLIRLGLSQLAVSIAAIAGIAWMLGVDPRIGVVIGMALALSSTAFALQPLTERGGLATRGGQATFAVLLFQDLAVIPMLAMLPLFGTAAGVTSFSWHGLGVAVLVIAATLVGGHYIARPVFRHIARTRLREVFTEFALLLVIVIALGFASAGLSMALGAFLAGMLLADSEYRHEIEAVLEPFKGLLMGLFFIAVGMTVDFGLLLSRPLVIIGIIVGFGAVKGVVLWVIAREARLPVNERPLFILLLAQGGEFAFVLVGLGAGQEAIPREVAQAVTLAVALSMLLTPFLLALHDQVLVPRLAEQATRPADEVPQLGRVIVAGLGRVGQVVARVLHASGYEPTVLDDNPDHVEQSRKFGFRAFYGDATRLDLLQAAGADRAEFLIIALDNPRATSSLARTAKEHFPNLRVVARARDMRHLFELRDIGVELVERETFRSALNLAERALSTITGDAERARRAARAFGRHDVEVVKRLYEVHRNQPDAHVTVSNELRDQLARTLRADEARMAAGTNGEVDPKSG
jgi:glutathione-regulated potassium-efflux system ancillary protein KefC